MSFVPISTDRYFESDGRLGFLMPFNLFKMQGGAGFRTFLTRKCKVNKIHDMVRLTPFENAVNRTSLLSLERGKTVFPVSSVTWDKKRGGALDESLSLSEAKELTTRTEMVMKPI